MSAIFHKINWAVTDNKYDHRGEDAGAYALQKSNKFDDQQNTDDNRVINERKAFAGIYEQERFW